MASLQMNKLPWWGQLLVFAGLGAIMIGAYYYTWEWPAREAMQARQAELDTIQARLVRGLETARKLPEFRAQVGDLESRLESLKAILPEEKDVADLLRRIQTMASQSYLTIRTFRPQAVNEHELHVEWPIALELEGSYHNVGQFLDRVSKFPRIINVGAITMTGHDQANGGSSLRVTCTATTFVMAEPAAEPAATPAKKAE